jgi:hypothetical protein
MIPEGNPEHELPVHMGQLSTWPTARNPARRRPGRHRSGHRAEICLPCQSDRRAAIRRPCQVITARQFRRCPHVGRAASNRATLTFLASDQGGAKRSKAEQTGARRSKPEQGGARRSKAEQGGAKRSKAGQTGSKRSKAEQSGSNRSEAEQSGARRSKPEQSGANRSKAEQSGARRSTAEQGGAKRAPRSARPAFGMPMPVATRSRCAASGRGRRGIGPAAMGGVARGAADAGGREGETPGRVIPGLKPTGSADIQIHSL